MDDFTAEMMASGQDETATPPQSPEDRRRPEPEPPTPPPQRSGLRGGIAAFREKASLQDRLVER